MQYIFWGLKERENKYYTLKNIVADSLIGGGGLSNDMEHYIPLAKAVFY